MHYVDTCAVLYFMFKLQVPQWLVSSAVHVSVVSHLKLAYGHPLKITV